MNSEHFLEYKSRTIIIVLAIFFIISLLLLVNIEFFGFQKIQPETSHFEYKYHHNQTKENKAQDHNANVIYKPERPVQQNSSATEKKSTKIYDDSQQIKMLSTSNMSLGSTPSCTLIMICTISCNGGTLQEVKEQINSVIETDTKCTAQYKTLELNSLTFPENAIGIGWLQGLSTSVNILKIKSTDLEELGDLAFSGNPFGPTGNPISLFLTDTNIKRLKKASFTNRPILVFEFRFTSMRQSITIEENLFGNASNSVQSISINYCLGSGELIKNLTGTGAVLAGLISLDLSYNMITKLESDSFCKAPNLGQVYLRSTGLTEIEVGAFKGLGKVSQLHISGNNLKILSEGVFDDLDSMLSLYLENNPFNCTCDMQWFKEYLMSLPAIEYRLCKVGSQWVDMEDIEFCPFNSTTTKRTTKVTLPTSKTTTKSPVTIPSSTPVYTNDFIFEKLFCRNILSYPFENITDDDSIFLIASVFKRRNINFTIIEIGDSLTYRVDLSGSIKSTDFLIWINVDNRSDYGCIYNINSYILMNLQSQKTYTLCFSSNDTDDTYALVADDCTAISTPTELSRRAWINNNQKTAVILSIASSFLITLGIASGAVYYLVKYNPELIKGNKRVLIVKRGSYSPNVLVMPSKKEAIRHVSLCTNYEGYLTPKLKRWAKYKLADMRYHELDTISDKSIDEEAGDKMMLKEAYTDDKNNDNNIYESPPLPPNHPGKRRDSGKPYFHSNM